MSILRPQHPPLETPQGAALAGRGVRRFSLQRLLDFLVSERSSPLQIGAGVALGGFLALTPFYGVHVWLALVLAGLLRVNPAGALLATQISNPLFAPALIVASVKVGGWMGFGPAAGVPNAAAKGFGYFQAWLAGGVLLGVVVGLALGILAGGVRLLVLRRRGAAPARPGQADPQAVAP